MKLRKFSLQGFKSVADKTTIDFDGGIIAIVGPNGCGKSNIADAIRWVTGEKSAKSMRSPSMTDVIFSGTEKRKPLGFAEVTLSLSDVDETLRTDYESLSITRRLHRSGESQYFVNKNQVRLKDIEQLLAGSGIGKNSISIFEQGKIDQVIYLTPEERRVIIEEVAGISRFNAQKKEALRNLKRTDENLSRVADILHEVEKQKAHAEKQAAKAAEYKEKSERLEVIEVALIVTKWRSLEEKTKSAEETFAALNAQHQGQSGLLKETEEKLAHAKQALEERRAVLKNKAAAHFEAKNRYSVKVEAGRLTSEKLKEAADREQELREEKGLALEQLQIQKERLEEGKIRLKSLEEKAACDAEEQHKASEFTESAREALSLLQKEFQERQNAQIQSAQKKSEAEGEWRSAKVRIEHLSQQIAENAQKQKELAAEEFQLKQAQQSGSEQLQEKTRLVSELEQVCAAGKEKKLALAQAKEEAQKERALLESAISSSRARLKVLQNLKEEMEGFSKATKALLKEKSFSVRSLFELLTLPKTLPSSAIQHLRSYAQTLVVKTKEETEAVLSFAKKNGFKEFSLLCLEHLSKEGDLAQQLLAHVRTVSTAEEGFASAGAIPYAAEDGTYIDVSKVLFVPGKEENNVFLREAEIAELEKEVTEAEKRLQNSSTSLEELRAELAEREKLLLEKEQTLRAAEKELATLRATSERDGHALRKFTEEKQRLMHAEEKFSAALKEETEQLSSLETRRNEEAVAEDEWGTAQSDLEEKLSVKKEKLISLQETLKAAESRAKESREALAQLSYDVGLLEMQIAQGKEQVDKLTLGIEKAATAQELLSGTDVQESSELSELKFQAEKYGRAVEEEEQGINQLAASLKEQESFLSNKRAEERESYEKKSQLEVRLSQQQAAKEALSHDLLERYHTHPSEVEVDSLENVKEAEKELKSLRRSIETIGAVNMAALEEKEEYQERYDHLSAQVEDLQTSKTELEEIIAQLEGECRVLFEETFSQVQENFRKNFEILFNGGAADLKLVGSEDILEAGVEVSARPPGKQMRSISLLSGGEKCMTALALLFAIFEVKPAPFCVLDEIDAPLDDTNVGRFVEILKQFTGKCQFVIITHNKRTMSIADTLFGVSMPEKGVSKMLSMEFQKETAIEPTLVEA